MSSKGSAWRFSPVRWPVRWRIAAVSAGLTFVILVVFALVVGGLAVDKLEDSFADEAQSGANNIANGFEVQVDPTYGRSRLNRATSVSVGTSSAGCELGALRRRGRKPYGATPGAPDLGPPPEQISNVG